MKQPIKQGQRTSEWMERKTERESEKDGGGCIRGFIGILRCQLHSEVVQFSDSIMICVLSGGSDRSGLRECIVRKIEALIR